jgi:Uma2 family endonuclease
MSTTARFSLEQYELMVQSGAFAGPHRQRVELIHGEIVQMNPIGSRHANTVDWLNEWSVKSAPLDRVRVRVQNPLRIPALDSEPEPDIAWMARKSYHHQHPQPADVLLVIEVSESSHEYDRDVKGPLYAAAGIADYWVVDIEANCLDVYREPSASGYQSHRSLRGKDEVEVLVFPEVIIAAEDVLALRPDI